MSERLGSVFDEVATDGVRGPDLRWTVAVPPRSVGDPAGVAVQVPLRLESDDGVVVDRARNPADAGDTIRIQVPEAERFPVDLRLRGMGGLAAGVPPGDLYLRVEIGGPPDVLRNSGASLARKATALGALVVLLSVLGVWCG